MNVLEHALVALAGSFLAGFLGALTGLGGGVVIVPFLVLLLGVDMHYAIGASLVSVIATSCGAAAAYVRDGFINFRVGMFLEVATVFGALAGAALAAAVPHSSLSVFFGIALVVSAWFSARPPAPEAEPPPPDRLTARLRMDSHYPVDGGWKHYRVRNVPGGFALMGLAGMISGLLGIGSGAFKVLALDRAMRLPFKVSTTTSNFMIGVTAAASAGVYLHRGYLDPGLAMPVMLGVLGGSALGARVLVYSPSILLRRVFFALIVLLAVQMVYHGLAGG